MYAVGTPTLWCGFFAVVLVTIALDRGALHRRSHVMSAREALAWSAVWIALVLGGSVATSLAWPGPERVQ